MSDFELSELSLSNLIKGIKNRDFTCLELMQSCLKNVSKYNTYVNAISCIDNDYCILEAKNADDNLSNGIYRGILHGIPIGVKDNYKTTNYPTTVCSNVLKKSKKDLKNATIIEKLKENGAIIMAKTNMHEWAFGATNEISNIGSTKNPWNKEYITGGSSGGSGAGLSTRMFPCALGSDTGGSIRIPSAGCGVVGIKPTYDLISKEGVYPLSFSLDVVGPMAKNIWDLEILFKVMLRNSKINKINYYEYLNSLKGLRFGLPIGLNFERNLDVDKVFTEAIKIFKDAGAIIEEVKLPYMKQGFRAWKTILHSEATAYHQENLHKYRDGFADNIRIMLESGENISAVDYLKSYQFRGEFIKNINKIFDKYDALLFTTLPVTPPKIGAGTVRLLDETISSQNSMIYLAWFANYTGSAQISLPCGFGDNNLPVGLAIMSKAMDDFKLLQIGKCYQKKTNFHMLKPTIMTNK